MNRPRKILLNPVVEMKHMAGDVEEIVQAFKKEGYEITAQQAYKLWRYHSSAYGFSWVVLPKDKSSIVRILNSYFTEV